MISAFSLVKPYS